MFLKITFLTLVSLAFYGCANRTVSKEQFQHLVVAHSHESICIYRYMGTEAGFHHLTFTGVYGSVTYRVPEADWMVRHPFPLTADKTQWQLLSPVGEFVTNSPPVEFYVPKEWLTSK
jgi:hypothetical protein